MQRQLAQAVLLLVPAGAQVLDTVAGGGAGDGGPAIRANLAGPEGIAVDGSGNLYIADTSNHRIRKVDRSGTIQTITSDGLLNFPVGVALSKDGHLLIADTYNHRIVRLNGTVVAQAGLNLPSAVAALPGGALLVADSGNGRIVRVDANGTLRPLATGLSRPVSVAAGPDGVVYASDPGSKRIVRIDPEGRVTGIARLPRPFGVALDTRGRLYASDEELGQVVRVDPKTVVPVARGLRSPQGIVVDGTGRIFVAEFAGNVVREVSPNGDSRVVAGNGEPFLSGDGGPARNAALNYPHGVATDRAGRLWIADTENNRIRRVSPGGVISTVASGLARPLGVAVDDAGKVYIADTNNHTVKVVDASGSVRTVAGTGVAGFGGDGGPAALGLLNYPTAVAVAGPFLYIADSGNHRIRALAEGRIHTVAAGLPGPSAIAVDEGGNLWIADRADHRIRRLTEQGHVETVVTPPLARPLGIAVDARNNVFISSGDGNSIYRIDVSGNVTIVAGVTAGLSTPSGLAIGPTGALFIADSGKHRIRRLLGAAVEPPSLSTVRLIPPITTREPATLSKSLAPYVATPETIATRMLELASVTPADVVYDLGCGDGRIPVLAAKRFGARAVGVEIDEALVRVAREQGQRAGVSDRVNIVHGDLLTTDFAAATVIVLYLLPDALPKLRPVIEQGIRKPVRVISHDARVEGWIPTITESVPGDSGRVHLLYRYDLRPTAER